MSRFIGSRIHTTPSNRMVMNPSNLLIRLGSPKETSGYLERPIIALDISAFGGHQRDEFIRKHMRKSLYRLVRNSFRGAQLPWLTTYREDRGDGVLMILHHRVPLETLLHQLADHLRAELGRYNKVSSEPAQIKLRMAVHAGRVQFDRHGVLGDAVIHTFRLLDAPAFKREFAASTGHLGLVASDHLYEEVIRHDLGLVDSTTFQAVHLKTKETSTRAWVRFPAARPLALRAVRSEAAV